MTPDQHTIAEHFIEVGDGHTLYVQDWGNKAAKTPIVYLHGGPGASFKDRHKLGFNPTKQRVIFFDQRGAGRSIPAGSLENNTTEHLVDDIEIIATKLGLVSFVITGGSWGACLALAYSLKYPKRVHALVLSGIYTGSKAETTRLDNGEVWQNFFPDVWQDYLNRTPKEHQGNPSAYHHQMAVGDDPSEAKLSAYAYSELESSLLRLDDRHTAEDFEEFDPSEAKIELHYLSNDCFLPDRYIMDNAHKLTMPVWLVQGRYDMVCPPTTAYELNQQLPNSNLIWTTAGHVGGERATFDVTRALLLQITQ